MPRRKAVKKPAPIRRSSIQVAIDHSVPEHERKRKLEAFIADFESERQARLRAIRDDGENLIYKINSLFRTELLKIPQPVRDMKYVEFRDKYKCDVNFALLQSTQAELDKIKKPTTIRKGRKTKKTTAMFETIDENRSEAPGLNTARMTRTAARVKGGPVWADTPLVTPAFNPRLVRAAKPKQKAERCTFLFDQGSSPKIEIPVNGNNVILSKDSELTEESRGVLEDISRMINSMLTHK